MELNQLKAWIQEYDFDHIWFRFKLVDNGNNQLCQEIGSYSKYAIETIASAMGVESNWMYDDTTEKIYFISFF